MQFSVARPDVVRAINQRWLLTLWNRHAAKHRVPTWKAVEAEDLSRLAANLSILSISGGGGAPRFLIRFHGEMVGQVYGSPDCRGKYLDEIFPPERHAQSLAPYYRAQESGYPVYTIHDIIDRNGRLVHYERLLLPFANDGQNIDYILASLEFVCPDGAFEGRELMKSQATLPTLRLSATIQPHVPI